MQRADAWSDDGDARALPRALRAEDRAPVRGRLPAGRAARRRRAPGAPTRWARFGAGIGLAFQIFDDVLDVSGPPERTGKPRGTDLLDGTVTLPLILARERDPGWRRSTCERGDQSRPRPSGVRPDRGHGRAGGVARARRSPRGEAKRSSTARLPEGQRAALDLVADGVVERYA